MKTTQKPSDGGSSCRDCNQPRAQTLPGVAGSAVTAGGATMPLPQTEPAVSLFLFGSQIPAVVGLGN